METKKTKGRQRVGTNGVQQKGRDVVNRLERTPKSKMGQASVLAVVNGIKKRRLHTISKSKSKDFITMKEVHKFFGNVEWAWQSYIPIGHLTMLVGPQGVGKSYLAANLIAVLTGSVPKWPDGQEYIGDTGPVLLVETEEMRGEYCTRMKKLGVPDDMVLFPSNPSYNLPTYTVDLIQDLELVETLAREGNCVAIVVDSLSGSHFLDEKSDKMRHVLLGLVERAGALQLPVIVVHHTRKRGALEAEKVTLDRVRGSSTITQFCRSVIGMYRIVDNQTTPVRVETVKSSFCPPPEPFGFTIGKDGLTFCEAPEEPKSRTAVDDAAEFLQRELAKKPMQYRILQQLAEEEGITKNTLYRAKNRIGIISETGVWRLPTIDETLNLVVNQI